MADDVVCLTADYEYAHDEAGSCTYFIGRERLVKRGKGKWVGRVHESKVGEGAFTLIDPELVRWVHHPSDDRRRVELRLGILRRWVEDEPDNALALQYLSEETLTLRHI